METLESLITGAGEIRDQNKAIVREFFAAVDNQDFGKLNELLSDDFVLKSPVLAQTWTKEDVFKDIVKYYTAFPDWKHSIEELVAEGDKVAVQVIQRGTHKASYEGIEPTGTEVTKPGVHIITLTDCRIREWWGMEEELGFMQQLGMELRKKHDLDINSTWNDLRTMEVNHKTAVDKKDIEGILQFYASDLINIPQGEPILYGRDQLRILLVELLKTYDFHEDFRFVDIKALGERVAASYTFGQKMVPFTEGDIINRTGKGLCILKWSEPGNWQFEWNSYSYNDMPETGNSQRAAVDIEKEKAAVSESFDQLLGAIEKEDLELLENILCDDADLIFFGTDANERWVGKKALIAAHKEFFRATSDSSMEIYNKTIHISLSGTVAWTSCIMNWDITSGGQPLHLKGLRLTMVFEKRDDEWFAVQTHGSIPPSGQSIEY
jgi:steroid delta-isomerase-like uncharacterized protein